MGQASFTTPGAATWTCPSGVTSVTIECWGPGGNGADGVHLDDGIVAGDATGGGGGGGAYALKVKAVTPGHVYNLVVGGHGVQTSFETDCIADFGSDGQQGSIQPGPCPGGECLVLGPGGLGGRAANSTGDSTENGTSGSSNNGGGSPHGGSGGTGGFLTNATPGGAPGGGGGGGGLVAEGTQAGAAGAAGEVLITWATVDPQGIPSGEAFGTTSLIYASGSSTLPAGLYTGHHMTTANKDIISPDVGAQYGVRQRPRNVRPIVPGTFRSVSGLDGTSALPAGVYTAHSMATALKDLISPDTSSQTGERALTRVMMFGDAEQVTPAAIDSAEAFGGPAISIAGSILPTGIDSAEDVGTPSVGPTVGPSSIATAESFGTPEAIPGNVDVDPSGIASGEAFGTAFVKATIGPSSIASEEHFGGVAIHGALVIRVVINGNPVTAELFYEDQITWNRMRQARGTCSLPFIVAPGDPFSPQVGEPIEIFDPPDVRVWAGTVETPEIRWLGDDGWKVITITGVTYESLFDTAQIDKVQYTSEHAGDIFADLFTRSGVTGISLGTVDAGALITSLQVTRISDAFNTIALQSNKVWGIDPADMTIYFRDPLSVVVAWTMAAEDMLWETMRWKQTRADFRDAMVIQLPDGSGQVVLSNTADPSIGSRAQRLTLTSAFTNPGAIQEATAALRRFSMLPSQFQVQTDKPGIGLDKLLNVLIASPLEAGALLNGAWMVTEIEARVVPGLDQIDPEIVRVPADLVEKVGHFRYTAHLVNSLATAIFQGDSSSTVFPLPQPGTVHSITVVPNDSLYTKSATSTTVTITPAMPPGTVAVVTYDTGQTPATGSFLDTLNQLTPQAPTAGPAGNDAGADTDTHLFAVELSLTDLTVGDDIAPHPIAYHAGTATRGLAVLRKTLGADLTVRIKKNGSEIVTVTIPDTTVVDTVLEFDVVTGSPPVTAVIADKDVFSADILESDGAIDKDGIATITIEWASTEN